MSKPKVLLCGVGNVVVRMSQDIILRYLIHECGLNFALAKRFFSIPEYMSFAKGEITGAIYAEALRASLGVGKSDSMWRQIYDKQIYTVDVEVVTILNKVNKRGGMLLAFCTDSNPWQDVAVARYFQVEKYSVYVYRSHELGALMTQPQAFLYIAEVLGIDPADILLVEEKAEVLLAASECGLQTFPFQNSLELGRYLHARSII